MKLHAVLSETVTNLKRKYYTTDLNVDAPQEEITVNINDVEYYFMLDDLTRHRDSSSFISGLRTQANRALASKSLNAGLNVMKSTERCEIFSAETYNGWLIDIDTTNINEFLRSVNDYLNIHLKISDVTDVDIDVFDDDYSSQYEKLGSSHLSPKLKQTIWNMIKETLIYIHAKCDLALLARGEDA